MRLNQSLGVILLAIWLILTGLLALLTVAIPGESIILSFLALAAGVFILIRPAHLQPSIGVIVLSFWLILSSLFPLLGLVIPSQDLILALLAIVAGVLLLLSRGQ